MSRIGKLPVPIPSGVTVQVNPGVVTVQGPKGKLDFNLGEGVAVESKDNEIVVSLTGRSKQAQANYGTTRAIMQNMVKGVTDGWVRKLVLSGVGFTAKLQGSDLVLAVGYSHDVVIPIPQLVTCKVAKQSVELESIDRQLVGRIAAKIRSANPPEPYLGKGVRFAEEVIRRKAGKAGKK